MNQWLIFSFIFSLAASVRDDVSTQMDQCAQIESPSKRLQCFDALSRQISTNKPNHYIQPELDFLQSELRVDKNRSDFSLQISEFIDLLQAAKLDSGKKIEIIGWKRRVDGYTLIIDMRSTTQLHFTHEKNLDTNYCVLAPVMVDGTMMDPSLFVLNIAAMSPDE